MLGMRCEKDGKEFHRCAATSAQTRKSKKLTQKQNWFKGRQVEEEAPEDCNMQGDNLGQGRDGKPGQRGHQQSGGQALKIMNEKEKDRFKEKGPKEPSTVLFVEFSKRGSLQKTMRDVVDRVRHLAGFTMRVTERGGTPLSSLLSSKNCWRGEPCGREDCRVCKQAGEKPEDCKQRNILYESHCIPCSTNDEVTDMKGKREGGSLPPSLYVGESARSLYERSSEHWGDLAAEKENSHILDHQKIAHRGERGAKFKFQVIKTFKTSLERQVSEAIRIQRRGENILNRKGEYNRSSLTRLVLDRDWEKKRWEKSWETEDKETELSLESGWEDEDTKLVRRGGKEGLNGKNSKRIKVENEEGDV